MNSVYLKTKGNFLDKSRFYALYMVPDLWGGVSLVREFGEVGRPGTLRLDWHRNKSDARREMNLIKRRQIKQGFAYIN